MRDLEAVERRRTYIRAHLTTQPRLTPDAQRIEDLVTDIRERTAGESDRQGRLVLIRSEATGEPVAVAAPRKPQSIPSGPRPAPSETNWTRALLIASLILLAGVAVVHDHPVAAGATLAVLTLFYWRIRQAVRYTLAVLGMTVIRAIVIRQTERYRAELGPAGRVTDPDAPWRQWLDTRCGTCGT